VRAWCAEEGLDAIQVSTKTLMLLSMLWGPPSIAKAPDKMPGDNAKCRIAAGVVTEDVMERGEIEMGG
jgi:hypothetical protein